MKSLRRLPTILLLILACFSAPPVAAQQDARLDEVRHLLDRGEGEEALSRLRSITGKKKTADADVLFLRSTAHFMAGDPAAGYDDLMRALELDPTLRQGWLNLAGLEIAEGRYDAAYAALLKAEKLDPSAPDNHLNLGAVLVMQGKTSDATKHFDRYIAMNPGSAEAQYLVASNYGLAGDEERVVRHLGQAMRLDERMRLRAREDERFSALKGTAYRELLSTDSFVPPPGSQTRAAAFNLGYARTRLQVQLELGGEGAPNQLSDAPELIYIVLDALRKHHEGHNPKVEVTDSWALVWGENLRVKIYNQTQGSGVVSLTAPPGRYTDKEFEGHAQRLFKTIYELVEARNAAKLRLPGR